MYFPSGEYYVGDVCYVLSASSALHERLFQAWEHVGWKGSIACTYQAYPIWNAQTAYGDGTYRDTQGRTYAVDSGSLGLLPLALCEPDKLANLHGLGHIVTFAEGFTPCWHEGVFRLGHLTINTRDFEEEE